MRIYLVGALLCALAITSSSFETRTERVSILATYHNLTADARAYVAEGPNCDGEKKPLWQTVRVGVLYPICKVVDDTAGWQEVGTVELSPFTTQVAFVYALFTVVCLSSIGDGAVGIFMSQIFAFAFTSFAVGLDEPNTVVNHTIPVILYLSVLVFSLFYFKPTWWTMVVWVSFIYFLKMFADVFPQIKSLTGFAEAMLIASTWALSAYSYFSIGFAFTVILGYLRAGLITLLGTWALLTALVLSEKVSVAYFAGTLISVASLLSIVRYESSQEEAGESSTQEQEVSEAEQKETVNVAQQSQPIPSQPTPVPQQQSQPSATQPAEKVVAKAQALETFQTSKPATQTFPERPQTIPSARATPTKTTHVYEVPAPPATPSPSRLSTNYIEEDAMDLDRKGQKRPRDSEVSTPSKIQRQ